MENFIKVQNKKKKIIQEEPKRSEKSVPKKSEKKSEKKSTIDIGKFKENFRDHEKIRKEELLKEKPEVKKISDIKPVQKLSASDYNPHLLKFQSKWIFYDHMKSEQFDYDECTRFIASFDNVSDFWSLINNLPKPSDLFYQKEIGKPHYIYKEDPREVSSISMFRDGIAPKWEDPLNRDGGEIALKKFFYNKNIVPIDYVDSLWIRLIINIIGEQFTNSLNITGIRVVDSYNTDPLKSSDKNKPLYRIEMWFTDISYKELYEKEIRSILNLAPNDKIIFKSHAYNIEILEKEIENNKTD